MKKDFEKFEKIAFEDLENVAGGQITPDEAIAAALKHANLTKDDVIMKKAKIDHEDGGLVYEVEFFHKGLEYEYDIDPKTGAVLKVDKDWD